MSIKKILIIGGTGILGKAVISEALKEKANITIIGLSLDYSIPKEVNQIITEFAIERMKYVNSMKAHISRIYRVKIMS